LGCQVVGDPIPSKKWFLNGRDESWLNRHTATAPSESLTGYNTNNHIMAIDDVTPGKDNGNFTCYVENSLGSDSVTYNVLVQVPPEPASVHILQTSSTSITARWRITDNGYSPINKIVLNYKMTYGEWAEKELAWHQNEYTLNDLHCGREYHLYVVLYNGIGPSATSKVLTARTLGSRPTGPNEADLFVQSNTTYLSLKLDTWSDHRCEILYFVVEYKLAAVDTWSTVTNDLQPQARYSIRGLTPNTEYDLKVTAHNHAGSTTIRYATATLPVNYSGAAGHFGRGGRGNTLSRVLMGLGIKSILLIVVSSLCLVLASIGVCVCLRKKHPPHTNIGYGEIPKSCTMENRQNLVEHQIYATIQRKQPPMPPFGAASSAISGGPHQFHPQHSGLGPLGPKTSLAAGTLDRLKMLKPRRSVSQPGAHTENGLQQQQHGSIDSTADIRPYATAAQSAAPSSNNGRYQHFHHLHHNNLRSTPPGSSRCATLGRIKTLEMTEYQKDKLLNEANTVKIRESKEYTLSLGRNHKVKSRKPYSESDAEYDLETDTDNSSGESGGGVRRLANSFNPSSGMAPGVDREARGQGVGCTSENSNGAAVTSGGHLLNNQRAMNHSNMSGSRQQQQLRATFGSPYLNNQQPLNSANSRNQQSAYRQQNLNL